MTRWRRGQLGQSENGRRAAVDGRTAAIGGKAFRRLRKPTRMPVPGDAPFAPLTLPRQQTDLSKIFQNIRRG
jgi:hypothetical protein